MAKVVHCCQYVAFIPWHRAFDEYITKYFTFPSICLQAKVDQILYEHSTSFWTYISHVVLQLKEC